MDVADLLHHENPLTLARYRTHKLGCYKTRAKPILKPTGWRGWFVTGLLYPRLRVRPRPKSVDFHDAENRQRPCRKRIGHVKDPYNVFLAWKLSAESNPGTGSHCQSSF
ncbi:hypothetical protein TNCV_4396751 [Trichonephila clavipes]|uniref:Uncharacterized protein n=1 Tax=Trichonephila clavipes TaxID=2585209 RepID=A0A8X6W4V4_TRICX|nr:hypothetical protein TNCV_4396751 [Trichonephila clavipes]